MRPKRQELDPVLRVYLRHGRAAHLLPEWFSANDGEQAMCGVQPLVYDAWRGTGTQDEHERAAELPTCLSCERARRRPTTL